MPTIVKLPPEEVQQIQGKGKSQRQLIAEQYDALLADFAAGDWGDVALDPDDKRQTVRGRLNAAAQRRGIALRFARGREDHMRFQVVAIEDVPEQEPEAPALAVVSFAPIGEASASEAPMPAPAEELPVEEMSKPEAAAPIAEVPKRRGGRPRKAQEQAPNAEPATPEMPKRRGGRRKATDASP